MESHSIEKIEYSEQAQELQKKYLAILIKDPVGASEKVFHFAHNVLLQNHTKEELHDYEAYCIVIGSTPSKQPERFDLEGDESIVQFIEHIECDIEEPEEK